MVGEVSLEVGVGATEFEWAFRVVFHETKLRDVAGHLKGVVNRPVPPVDRDSAVAPDLREAALAAVRARLVERQRQRGELLAEEFHLEGRRFAREDDVFKALAGLGILLEFVNRVLVDPILKENKI